MVISSLHLCHLLEISFLIQSISLYFERTQRIWVIFFGSNMFQWTPWSFLTTSPILYLPFYISKNIQNQIWIQYYCKLMIYFLNFRFTVDQYLKLIMDLPLLQQMSVSKEWPHTNVMLDLVLQVEILLKKLFAPGMYFIIEP